MSDLAKKQFKAGSPLLSGEELAKLARELNPGWQVVEEHHLERELKSSNFRQALDFTNRVGELAESLNHHPDIYLAWGKVKLTLWSHEANGLTQNDFIFAAKVDLLPTA
jgi:4a-hydroxytetrahydrobiopterin dehydratase